MGKVKKIVIKQKKDGLEMEIFYDNKKKRKLSKLDNLNLSSVNGNLLNSYSANVNTALITYEKFLQKNNIR